MTEQTNPPESYQLRITITSDFLRQVIPDGQPLSRDLAERLVELLEGRYTEELEDTLFYLYERLRRSGEFDLKGYFD